MINQVCEIKNQTIANDKIDIKSDIKMWDIYMADIPKENGRRQCGLRPVLIFSNDKCLKFSDYITIVPFTTKLKRLMPTHLLFNKTFAENVGLKEECVLIGEQIGGLDKKYLKWKIGSVSNKQAQAEVTRKVLTQMLGNYDLNYVTEDILNHPF